MTGDRTEHRIATLCAPLGHYSDAVSYNGILYLSGIAPIDVNGSLVGPDDISLQAEQVFSNIGAVLENFGVGFDSLLKITVFLTAVNDRKAVNEVRRRMFGTARPASTLIGIADLGLPNMKIEVEAIAALAR